MNTVQAHRQAIAICNDLTGLKGRSTPIIHIKQRLQPDYFCFTKRGLKIHYYRDLLYVKIEIINAGHYYQMDITRMQSNRPLNGEVMIRIEKNALAEVFANKTGINLSNLQNTFNHE